MAFQKLISIFGFLLLVTYALSDGDICTKPFEVYTECDNNACLKNCDDMYVDNTGCNETPYSGCICQPGYFRNTFGKCVLEEKCGEGVCEENEEYHFCQPCPKGKICTAQCVGPSVCLCIKGYKRHEDGKCIKPGTCTGENEVYDYCPGPEVTCEDKRNGVTPSGEGDACVPACVCEEGYVRKENGKCVLPEDCCADPNAEVISCPYLCGGGTCANPEIDRSCKKHCIAYPKGCQCKRGFTRKNEQSSVCIPITKCNVKNTIQSCAFASAK